MINRMRIMLALALMPDEAFSWFVMACRSSAMTHGANAQIWPDGIGGFSDDSKKSINEIRSATEEYIAQIK